MFAGGRRFQRLEEFPHLLEFAAQVVAGRDLADSQAQRGKFPGQKLGIGLGLLGSPAVFVEGDLVAVFLAILGQQNQRRRVGSLR